ncbi:MAG TPA: Maf family protein [Calditerricola sp.]
MTIKTKPLVLASGSPRRRELLAQLGLSFEVRPSDVDESLEPETAPAQAVETLALRKARAVAAECSEGLVIGSDTVVVIDREILGKPRDAKEAEAMLRRLAGRTHRVYTGLAVVDAETGACRVGHSVTAVRMSALTDAEIRRYVATGEPMDKAGAYAIQGIGATLVTHIEGDYFTVVGLPLFLLRRFLGEMGVHIL